MPETNDFNAIRISLTSPEQIKNWSYGEVTKPETINYRTLKPEKDGLFCERIFGPTKDFECYCGKYKRVRYKGIVCDRCGVEVARSKVRRERMAHIELAAPVSHLWFAKGTPSRMGLLLDLSPRALERVLYFSQYIVTEVDAGERERVLEELRDHARVLVEEAQEEVAAKTQELQNPQDEPIAELQQRRQVIEEQLDEELAAAVAEAENAAAQARKSLKGLRGKPAKEEITLYDEPLLEKASSTEERHLEEVQARKATRLEGIQARFAEERLNRTDPVDAEIELLREQTVEQLNQLQRNVDQVARQADEEAQAAAGEVEEVRPRMLLPENRYRELREKFGEFFKAGMGAEAILACLEGLDLEALRETYLQEIHSTSGQRRKKAAKTLRVVEAFRRSNNDPRWMILKVLPVLPPDLRPMVQLDGGRFATSDLNDLYRRVINRNNRLRRLLELGAPEIIIRNEKRMLQEAIDALIDNGRRGRAIAGSHNHKLKSLSDMLRGKQGRFRQNLLGKRVDYSGRSVIVVGPGLQLHQCGLPKRMALELFKPFVMHHLVARGLAHNIKSAKRMVERVRPEVWDVLEEVIRGRPVFLNRAPTLHRLGIQAFQPTLIEGSAIQIHPLVCAAFNADFDGDQMAVHVPLSHAAIMEANKLMLSTHSMLSPSSGEPVVAPTLDMVLGCYYLTLEQPGAKGEGARFGSREDARRAYDLGVIDLQAEIEIRGVEASNGFTKTTVGRVIFNEVLPQGDTVNFRNELMDKKALKDVVADCYHSLGNEETAKVLDSIKDLGFHYATKSGATIAITDVEVPEIKPAILEKADKQILSLERQFQRGLITEDERYRQAVDIWTGASETMEQAIRDRLDSYGSISLMATSGAKGNIAQIKQMAGMRGLMTDPRGRIIELPIRSSFREGLSVLEYFISTHGARKGLADTALRTADSGYLTRRLIDVCQDVIVMEEDCETTAGIWIQDTPDKPLMGKFEERVVGRCAASPIAHPATGEILVETNEEIDVTTARELHQALHDYRLAQLKKAKVPARDLASAAANWMESVRYLTEQKGLSEEQAMDKIGMEAHRVHARSPLACRARRGICRVCYGRSLARGRLVEVGEAVGIIAAQSIGEPGTQLTMRTFHTGGVAGLDITSGLPRVEELFEARSPRGQATVAEIDGQVEIRDGEDGRWASIVSTETYSIDYPLPAGYRALVEDGSLVEVGTPLAQPAKSPKPAAKSPKKAAKSPKPEEGSELAQESQAITARIAGRVSKEDGRLIVSYEERDERHYAVPPAARLIGQVGQRIRAGDRLTEGPVNPQDILRIQGRERVEEYLTEEVQKVYRAQGVAIHDKHIEVVVRQMLRKVRVDAPGDTELLPGHLIDRFSFEDVNAKFVAEGGEPSTAQPVLLGVTKASLNTESFLAAASFQETTRVLTEAAVNGAVDRLLGPKENVIIGRLIPARSKEVAEELAKPRPVPLFESIGPDGESLHISLTGEEESLLEFLEMTEPVTPSITPLDGAGEEADETPGLEQQEESPVAVEETLEEPKEQRIFEPD